MCQQAEIIWTGKVSMKASPKSSIRQIASKVCKSGILKRCILHAKMALSFRPTGGIPSLHAATNYGIPRSLQDRRKRLGMTLGDDV